MNIVINASSIFKGGAEQVAHSFINECISYPEHNFYVLLRDNIKSQLEIDRFPNNFTFYDVKERPGKSVYHIYSAIRSFDKIAEKINPDVIISTGGHGFWKPDIPTIGGFNIPHYIYPESPYFDNISVKKKLYWDLKKVFDLYFYRRLDAIVVQTDDVKERLASLFNGIPIYSISNTINAAFNKKEFGESLLDERGNNEFRLLTVSADYQHKNLSIISDVAKQLQSRGLSCVKFVLTLPEGAFEFLQDTGIGDQVINIGPVSINECPVLYRDCDAMFLPTLLECFSASYAEAMKMEKPILTSDLGFAHTVCKKAALYFNPLDSKDIADNIERLIRNSDLYQVLASEGRSEFTKLKTPAERANSFISIAESLVEKSNIQTV